jgi:hypothetical protein
VGASTISRLDPLVGRPYSRRVDLQFRRGTPDRPRGHALAYFETPDGRIYATYLVIPPIQIDLAKYMPPMFAGQIPVQAAAELSAMPLPPIPEEVAGGLALIDRLAELRDDDVVSAGTVDPRALDRLLRVAAEAGQAYVGLYKRWQAIAPTEATPRVEASYDVDEVLLSLESEHDRIGRLARLVGQLRYALEGGDRRGGDEALAEMERVGRSLPEKYRVAELLAAANRPGDEGARLAQLLLERSYKLCQEEYADVARLEAEIKKLTT